MAVPRPSAQMPHLGRLRVTWSEWIGRNLRAGRDPLPLAELIGVGQRAVIEAIA